jgi:outer membrane receptor protein involved in Fe transport
MRGITTLILCIHLPFLLFSQLKKLTGRSTGTLDTPIEYAEVNLLSKDSTILKTDFTNRGGEFRIEAEAGIYILVIKFMGYKNLYKDIDLLNDLDLGTLSLALNPKLLKDVTVQGNKKLVERRADRVVFNIGNSMLTSGSDALGVLKTIPGLRFKNEQLSIVGKSSVAVMINDRIVQMSGAELISFLNSIKSDDIKSIEVITNPPAKYDAEGNSGLININLKKPLNDSWNASLSSSWSQASYPSGAAGASFAYRKRKLSFTTGIDYRKGSRKRIETDELFYSDQIWNAGFKKILKSNIWGTRTGLDYEITSKWLVGAQYLGSFSTPKVEERDITIISNPGKLVDSFIVTDAPSKRKINANSFNIHSDITVSSGTKLFLNADYFRFISQINRDFNTHILSADEQPLPGRYKANKNLGNQAVSNYALKADFETRLKGIKLSYGTKFSFTQTDNDLQYFDISTNVPMMIDSQSNTFKYTERTQAFYVSTQKKLGKIWEISGGLRLENTQTKGNSVTYSQVNKNAYVQLFPTAYVVYNLNDNNSFRLNYGRRIRRPGYSNLNPFRFYSSPFNYTEGNPFLKPQYTHNIEFSYSYKENLNSKFYFSKEQHGFDEVPFVQPDTKIQYFTQLNYYTYNTVGFSQSYTFDVIKWLESENQLDLYYSESLFNKEVNMQNTRGWGAYFSTSNSIVLNKSKTLKGAINFWYQSPAYDLLFKNKYNASLELGVRYGVLHNALQLSAVIQDALKTEKYTKTTFTNNTRQIYFDYSDNRLFRLSATYKFGNKKINVKTKAFGNEDEKKRAN